MSTRCESCGHLDEDWTPSDAAALLAAAGEWWDLATAPPAVPSTEVVELGATMAGTLASALGAVPGVPTIGESLRRDGGALARLMKGARRDGDEAQRASGLELVHAIGHGWADVAVALAAGAGSGAVAGLHVSAGGVPKLAVGSARVGWRGMEGDAQADRRHHGRPYQALCLWSAEVVAGLAAQGHPISSGCAGENVAIAGIDWAVLRPGVRMRIGTVLAEISLPSVPCGHQAQWFCDGDYRRIDHDRNPGAARWYAWVRRPGVVRTGDPVVSESPPRGLPAGAPQSANVIPAVDSSPPSERMRYPS